MLDKLVLVAIDELFVRTVACKTLSEIGFKSIVQAEDCEEAVEVCQEDHPDIVLLGTFMKGESSLESLSRIMDINPKTIVIMYAAKGQMQTLMECLSIGAIDYIVAPSTNSTLFDKDELSGLLRRAMGVI